MLMRTNSIKDIAGEPGGTMTEPWTRSALNRTRL